MSLSNYNPQNTYFKEFFELLHHNCSSEHFFLQKNYYKNIALLKNSLKIEQKMPPLNEIEKIYMESFLPKCLKSFFQKSKILFVWLISAYESLIEISFDKFVNSHEIQNYI